MRSPFPTPGRNRFLDNLWNRITGWIRGTPEGTIRPRAAIEMRGHRELSLEIPEYPIRDRFRAIELVEMAAHQPEVGTALRIMSCDAYSSEDGDDGAAVEVSPWLDSEKTEALDPVILAAASETLSRLFRSEILQQIAWRILAYGDCFGNLALAEGRGARGVAGLILLPTWEVFRIQDDRGFLIGFEQRRELDDRAPIRIYPGLIVHWRNGCYGLYGRSQFYECLSEWREYKRTVADLSRLAHEHAINPMIFKFDASMGQAAIDAFRAETEEYYASKEVVPRLYLPGSVEATKVLSRDGAIDSYLANLKDQRMVFVRASGIPSWRFPGLDTSTGAKDISGQPALVYSRQINRLRQVVAEGIKQVLVTDLALRFGIEDVDLYKRIRLQWPEFHVRPQDTQTAVTAQVEKQDPAPDSTRSPEAIPLGDRLARRRVNYG